MPELPEVETVKNGLHALHGTTISEIILRFPRLRYPLDPEQLNRCVGQKIQQITRRAKYLIFHLDHGYLIIHLGMSGRLTLHPRAEAPSARKHDHVDINTAEWVLRYNDARRFGCIVYVAQLSAASFLAELGPEPLTAEFNPAYLLAKLQNRKTPIKQMIMDNALVVGVGNIYACEALFISKISPLRQASNLNVAEATDLVENIKQVLISAIAAGGSSLRDYKNAHGELGYFQHSHSVYGRSKQPCKLCGTTIQDVRLGQRNSFYCPHCQS